MSNAPSSSDRSRRTGPGSHHRAYSADVPRGRRSQPPPPHPSFAGPVLLVFPLRRDCFSDRTRRHAARILRRRRPHGQGRRRDRGFRRASKRSNQRRPLARELRDFVNARAGLPIDRLWVSGLPIEPERVREADAPLCVSVKQGAVARARTASACGKAHLLHCKIALAGTVIPGVLAQWDVTGFVPSQRCQNLCTFVEVFRARWPCVSSIDPARRREPIRRTSRVRR